MKLSLTITGIITLVISQVLGDTVSNEQIANFIEVGGLIIGTIVAWIGRVRHQDINVFGIKK